MDESNREISLGEVIPAETETMIIGNTTYIVNTFYSGKETLENVLKRLIIRDLEQE